MNLQDIAKKKLGTVFMGAYRLSVQSSQHKKALETALQLGLSAVDTSANYTDGQSESLIGQFAHEDLFIITKAGYIQGQNLKVLEDLNAQGLALEDLVEVNEGLKHSIHPDFLNSQIELSLKRLKRDSIDCFLIHNPEYFFKVAQDKDTYYQRIEKAFSYLETQVQKGRIQSYGVSSNTFVNSVDSPDHTDLERVMKAAQNVSLNHHMVAVQFPFNLLELGAIERTNLDSLTFLEKAKEYGLSTLANRPLNAFSSEGQLLRLAEYPQAGQNFSMTGAQAHWKSVLKLMEAKLAESEEAGDVVLKEIPLIKQIDKIWSTLPSPDAVDQVFQGHFFPFVAQIWGGELSAQESQPFYQLYDIAKTGSLVQMNKRAEVFKKQAQEAALLSIDSTYSLAQQAVDFILKQGVDHVLLGMRDVAYVEEFKDWL